MGDQDFSMEQPLARDKGSCISCELGLIGRCCLVSGCAHFIYDADNHVRNLRGARAVVNSVVMHRQQLSEEVHTFALRQCRSPVFWTC